MGRDRHFESKKSVIQKLWKQSTIEFDGILLLP